MDIWHNPSTTIYPVLPTDCPPTLSHSLPSIPSDIRYPSYCQSHTHAHVHRAPDRSHPRPAAEFLSVEANSHACVISLQYYVVCHGPALEQIARDSANASCIARALLAHEALQSAMHHAVIQCNYYQMDMLLRPTRFPYLLHQRCVRET